MKIKEILQIEQKNTNFIFLHKEGLFWRAYERSAYFFTLYIKEYQIIKKFYKNVNSEVVYLGFHSNSLEQILQSVNKKNVQKSEKQIIVDNFQLDINKFIFWKSEIKLWQSSNTLPKLSARTEIITKIRNYPIVSKTPIECQQFIIELQKEITLSQEFNNVFILTCQRAVRHLATSIN